MNTSSLTGRQHHLIAKALAYAVNVIDALPKEHKALSDQADMKDLLEQMLVSDVELETYQRTALQHIDLLRR
jgi:hypothetical protein